ncbi:pseudouridine synthase [Agaribacterium haliotis]|uniref:pseudouridine synthase n=1 Tax=Agaribacterium haliotis TaxID=2013869 RepID=UPI000BB56BC2|nr:pseudouridine synthase [Agaribacterium haliotis]
MRLDKYIAEASGLSRSDVKKQLKSGRIRLNGLVCNDAKQQVENNIDCIELDSTPLALQGEQYLMLYKPPGYVSARRDSQQPCVFDLLTDSNFYCADKAVAPNANQTQLPHFVPHKKLAIVGRLDVDTSGLLLLSSDGQWNHRICSPKQQCFKLYQVELARPLPADAQTQLNQGLMLRGEDKATLPAQLIELDRLTVQLKIQEGRYHQVKRMMAALGSHVTQLTRLSIGELELDPQLKAGQFRQLSADEIALF